MSKCQGSKKKARKAAFLERQAMRESRRQSQRRYIDARNSGNIEEMADAMGVKLR